MRATDSGLLPQRHKPQTATETGGDKRRPPGHEKGENRKILPRSPATSSPSSEGAGGWVDKGAPPGHKKSLNQLIQTFFVPRTRLELARLKQALPPQSSVSTNFTIWALL